MNNAHSHTAASALYPAQAFYDGACPLCSREAAWYQCRDAQARLHFIDISAPDFNAASFGLDPLRVNEVMHVRTADGKIYTEVAAFTILRRAIPPTLLSRAAMALLHLPGATPLAGVFYRLFARNRQRLTGRCTPTTCAPTPRQS